MNTCTSRETRINPINAHFQSSSLCFFLKLGSVAAGFSGCLWNFSLKPWVARSLLSSVAVSSDQDPGPQPCRAIAPSTVGSVQPDHFLVHKLFLAHTTIGDTTSRLVGNYVFSCQASRSMQRWLWLDWKCLFLASLTSPIIPSISHSLSKHWGSPILTTLIELPGKRGTDIAKPRTPLWFCKH